MCVKSSWEKGANIELSEEVWIKTCRAHSSTSSSGLGTSRFFCPKKYNGVKYLKMGSVGECVVIYVQIVFIFSGIFFLLVGCGRDKDIFVLFISRMFHLTSKNKTDTCSYD